MDGNTCKRYITSSYLSSARSSMSIDTLSKIVQRWFKKFWKKIKRKAGSNKKRGRKTPPVENEVQQKTSRGKPKESEKSSNNNQFEALLMEEGEIPPLETIIVEIEEEEDHATTRIPPMSPRNERSDKDLEGSTHGGFTY